MRDTPFALMCCVKALVDDVHKWVKVIRNEIVNCSLGLITRQGEIFLSNESLMFRQGFAPRLNSRSPSNATPYPEPKMSRCAFRPDKVLSVKQTAFDFSGPSNSKVSGLKTLALTLPYHPTGLAFRRGFGGLAPTSRIERRRCLAVVLVVPLFWRTKCVRRKEQSELSRASARATLALVLLMTFHTWLNQY